MAKKKFRSGLESALNDKLTNDFLYEPFRLPYVTHRKYVPDFVHEESSILVEAKGYFRVGDTQKYKEAFLRDHDEIMILEVLEINGEELIEAFEDRLLRHREVLGDEY